MAKTVYFSPSDAPTWEYNKDVLPFGKLPHVVHVFPTRNDGFSQ